MGGIMSHIIYQYQKSHSCILQSGLPGNNRYSPQTPVYSHIQPKMQEVSMGTSGALGWHWLPSSLQRIIWWCLAPSALELPSSAWATSATSCQCSFTTNAAGLPVASSAHLAAERISWPFVLQKFRRKWHSYVILECTPWTSPDQQQMSLENWAGWDWGAL